MDRVNLHTAHRVCRKLKNESGIKNPEDSAELQSRYIFSSAEGDGCFGDFSETCCGASGGAALIGWSGHESRRLVKSSQTAALRRPVGPRDARV